MRARSACICCSCPVFNDFITPDHAALTTNLGELYEHIDMVIDSRIGGVSVLAAMALFSTANHATPSYTRNASNWAADYVDELTAISPWNSASGTQKAGILISPRHVLFATHYYPATSSTIRFVAADGSVCDRTLSAVESLAVSDAPGLYPDLTVGLLNSDVDAGIRFAKVLPASAVTDKLPNLNTYHLPAASTDQEGKLLVRNWVNHPVATSPTAYCAFQQPIGGGDDIARNAFYEGLVSGDSGSPLFVFINGELVLLTVATFGNEGAGTSVTAFIDDVNAAMTTLGGGYQLTEADVSGFADL